MSIKINCCQLCEVIRVPVFFALHYWRASGHLSQSHQIQTTIAKNWDGDHVVAFSQFPFIWHIHVYMYLYTLRTHTDTLIYNIYFICAEELCWYLQNYHQHSKHIARGGNCHGPFFLSRKKSIVLHNRLVFFFTQRWITGRFMPNQRIVYLYIHSKTKSFST